MRAGEGSAGSGGRGMQADVHRPRWPTFAQHEVVRGGIFGGISTGIDMLLVFFSIGYSVFLIDAASTTLTSSEIHRRPIAR